MPHQWNNIWVVTEAELIPAFFSSLNYLSTVISRHADKSYGIKKVQSGGNGRQLLISFDSLPNHIQTAIGEPGKITNPLEHFYKTDMEAVAFFHKHKIDGEYLSLAHQEEYITNASVLRACVALKTARENERKSKRGSTVGIMGTIVKDATLFNKVLKTKYDVQHTLQTSERWFKDSFKAFVKADGSGFNYESLISKKIRNTNAKKVTDETVNLLNDLFAGLGKKPTRTEISRQYDAFLDGYVEVASPVTGELYDPKEFKPLSDNTIISYLGAWSEKAGNYSKRSGDHQKFISQFKPYHSLDRPAYAGSIISIDDRQPPFKYAAGQRPWFYNGIDLASEAFTCWVYGKSKEGIILDFYRQLIRNYTEWGFCLPAELECESSLNSSFRNTFLRPGAMFSYDVRIEANNARGKRIEAYYKPLRYELEKERAGWLARPYALTESNQAGGENVPMIPYSQIIEGCLNDIQTWNNMPHSVHKDKTRWEVFTEMQHPELKPTNWKAILPYLGYKTATSCGDNAIIKLQNKEFLLGDDDEIYLGEKLIDLMKKIGGRNIDCYWLDDNNGGVLKAIVYMGDTCICEALPKPTYNRAGIERTAKDEENRRIMSAYVASIDGYIRRKAANIKTLVVIDNRVKTLNTKFTIPSINRPLVDADMEPEMLPALPDDEDYYVPAPTGFVRAQKDRF